MLTGSAEIEQLAEGAAVIEAFLDEAISFPSVHCLQVTAEMKNAAREAVLPPALHPTIPPAISIQAWKVAESPWGPFDMVINRVYCRSGVRARGYTTRAFISASEPCEQMRGIFGLPAVIADIDFRHGYDGADLSVSVDGQPALSLAAIEPEPMGLSDVQYTGTLNLAQTPKGLRLVQVEAHHLAAKVDRLTATLHQYDGALCGNPLLIPEGVVSASLCQEQVEFPAVRFVCRPDELAFTGTEAV